MEKRKFFLHGSIIAVACLVPLIVVSIIGGVSPSKYDKSFYGGLVIKDDRLDEVKNKKKIIFVGGSSLSFGLRSDMMSEALGYEVVDYGLYAPLGTKMMSELVKDRISKDDIVIFAPELSVETYSINMNHNMLLKCVEKKQSIVSRLSFDDHMDTVANYPYFVVEKAVSDVEAKAPYDKASFNKYGDIANEMVNQNIMMELYDSSQLISPSSYLLNKDFIKYLNDYASYVKKKGANIYFTFSPTNALALKEEHLNEFEKELKEKLSFDVLGNVKELTYHQNYFYDTNYHLNYAGTIVHSEKLTDLIANKLNIKVSYEFPEVEMPRAKYDPEPEPEPEPEKQDFVVNKIGDEYFLMSVDESLKEKEVIVIPNEIDGHVIKGISADAFKDFTKLKIVILPDKVDNLSNNIFNGCSSLEKIYLRNEVAPAVVGKGFLEGCNPAVKICILKNARSSYTAGYTWIDYSKFFELYVIEDISQYLI